MRSSEHRRVSHLVRVVLRYAWHLTRHGQVSVIEEVDKHMRSSVLFILLAFAGALHAETLQEIAIGLPIGTTKEEILKKEPSAKVVPCMVTPKDATTQRECIVLMKSTEKKRIIAQFYLVNDALAAMFLSGVAIPTPAENDIDETAYFSSHPKISTFSALRADSNLNPIEIQVERLALDSPNQVALMTSTERGKELWIVDESVFDSKAFFMEPSTDNKNKLLKSKEAIDAQRKSYEETR